MALAKTVTKMFPTPNRVGIHLKLTDDDRPDLGPGVQIVIDRNFAGAFITGSDMQDKVRDEIGKAAQTAIDAYKKLRAVYDATAYGTKVTQISNALKLQE